MVGSPRVIAVSPLMLRAIVQMTWAIAPAAMPNANDAACGGEGETAEPGAEDRRHARDEPEERRSA